MKFSACLAGLVMIFFCSSVLAEVRVAYERLDDRKPVAPFRFKTEQVPSPARGDAGSRGRFALVDGQGDGNGGGLAALNDDRLPQGSDHPQANFFFVPASKGGRLRLDLGGIQEVIRVNTYSWHPAERGPQVYTAYVSDGKGEGFRARPKRPLDPAKCGWTKLARVDTRIASAYKGGQFGVSISDSNGSLGNYRYLLLDVERTGLHRHFDQTFFSEVDVIAEGDDPDKAIAVREPVTFSVRTGDDKYGITFDLSAAPDLEDWVREVLLPVSVAWYPKVVDLLPSEGFVAPETVMIRFRNGMGPIPASARGNVISCNPQWFRRNLKGEAKGSVVHEMVHVVQQYKRGRSANRPPGWLVEGLADYIRWFLYEPETRGAEITKRNLARAKYDASYRVTGNFLNWVSQTYDKEIVRKLNAEARAGRYAAGLWKDYTGKELEVLGREWREHHAKRLGVE